MASEPCTAPRPIKRAIAVSLASPGRGPESGSDSSWERAAYADRIPTSPYRTLGVGRDEPWRAGEPALLLTLVELAEVLRAHVAAPLPYYPPQVTTRSNCPPIESDDSLPAVGRGHVGKATDCPFS